MDSIPPPPSFCERCKAPTDHHGVCARCELMVQAVIELNEADAARTIASGEVSANRVEDYVAAPIVPDKEISAETIEQLEREVEALRREAETLEAKSREFRLPPLVSVRSGAFVKVFSLLVFLAGVATGLSTCMIVAGAH